MEKVAEQRPDIAWKILVETTFNEYKLKIMSQQLEKSSYHENLDKLAVMAAEQRKTSGHVPAWLKEYIEDAQKQEEFEAYLKLFCEAKSRFGVDFWMHLICYIEEHHVETYLMKLYMCCSSKEK